MSYAVILVDSTSHAVRIEKLLAPTDIVCKLIPVPRHLSSDCGVCIRIDQDDMERIRQLLDQSNAPFRSIEVI